MKHLLKIFALGLFSSAIFSMEMPAGEFILIFDYEPTGIIGLQQRMEVKLKALNPGDKIVKISVVVAESLDDFKLCNQKKLNHEVPYKIINQTTGNIYETGLTFYCKGSENPCKKKTSSKVKLKAHVLNAKNEMYYIFSQPLEVVGNRRKKRGNGQLKRKSLETMAPNIDTKLGPSKFPKETDDLGNSFSVFATSKNASYLDEIKDLPYDEYVQSLKTLELCSPEDFSLEPMPENPENIIPKKSAFINVEHAEKPKAYDLKFLLN